MNNDNLIGLNMQNEINDFAHTLEPILEKRICLSKSNIRNLIDIWDKEFDKFQNRALDNKPLCLLVC